MGMIMIGHCARGDKTGPSAITYWQRAGKRLERMKGEACCRAVATPPQPPVHTACVVFAQPFCSHPLNYQRHAPPNQSGTRYPAHDRVLPHHPPRKVLLLAYCTWPSVALFPTPFSGKCKKCLHTYYKVLTHVLQSACTRAPLLLTCPLAYSRTLVMRCCVGWNTCPTLPMGFGFVTMVGKWPSGSSLGGRRQSAGAVSRSSTS